MEYGHDGGVGIALRHAEGRSVAPRRYDRLNPKMLNPKLLRKGSLSPKKQLSAPATSDPKKNEATVTPPLAKKKKKKAKPLCGRKADVLEKATRTPIAESTPPSHTARAACFGRRLQSPHLKDDTGGRRRTSSSSLCDLARVQEEVLGFSVEGLRLIF